MKRSLNLRILEGGLALIAAMILFSPALAHPAQGVSKAPKRLGLIVVNGTQMPLPVALEVLKTALQEPWSTARKDRNRIVCRLREPLGSHIRDREILRCATNAEHFRRMRELQLGWAVGNIQMTPPGASHEVDPARLRALLARLPPTGSSYTFKIMNHGHLLAEWVLHKGQVVKTWIRPARH